MPFDLQNAAMEAIGMRLRLTREAYDMSQTQFALMVGLSQQAWNNYEKGRRRIDLDQAFRVCAATGVTLDWIYFGDRSGLPFRIASKLPNQ